MKEDRVLGELAWAPAIELSTKPGEYTLDLAIIKIEAGKLDADNYRGNTINHPNEVLAHGVHGQSLSQSYVHQVLRQTPHGGASRPSTRKQLHTPDTNGD